MKLTGKVVSLHRRRLHRRRHAITLADYGDGRDHPGRLPRQRPDAFKAGREIVLDGTATSGVFHAKADSLVTKCPSKYTPGDADSAQS